MEQRRHPRVGPLVIRTTFPIRETSDEGYLTSLSEGGAFLCTEEQIALEEKLTLRLTLPWEIGEIRAEAEARYVISKTDPRAQSSRGVGLAFVGLSPLDRERIRHYVSKFHRLAARLEDQLIG